MGLGSFHVLADAMHAAGIHRVVGQCPILQQILKLAAVERVLHRRRQAGTNFRQIAVADRFDEQFAQWPARELNLAQHSKTWPPSA